MDENDCARYVDEVSNCQDKNELQVFASLKSVAFEEFGQKEENEVFSSDNPESCFQSYRSEDMRSEDDVLQSVRNEQLKLGSTTDSEEMVIDLAMNETFEEERSKSALIPDNITETTHVNSTCTGESRKLSSENLILPSEVSSPISMNLNRNEQLVESESFRRSCLEQLFNIPNFEEEPNLNTSEDVLSKQPESLIGSHIFPALRNSFLQQSLSSFSTRKVFYHGDEPWVACDTNLSGRDNQPSQTLLVPFRSNPDFHFWNPPEQVYSPKLSALPSSTNVTTDTTNLNTRKEMNSNKNPCVQIQYGSYSITGKFSNRVVHPNQCENMHPAGISNVQYSGSASCYHSFNPRSSSSHTQVNEMLPPLESNHQGSWCYQASACNLFASQVPQLGANETSGSMLTSESPTDQMWTYNNHMNTFNPDFRQHTFCRVPGRMGVLQERKKYVVTVGEIFRRVKAPESLNISLLAPILRKAKAKNGSQYLRQKLQMIGVELQHGRRKTAQCTLFTSLTEGEAMRLAEDFKILFNSHFPSRLVAVEAMRRCQSEEELSATLFQSLPNAIKLLDFFIQVTEGCSSTGFESADGLGEQLYNFDALTHCFGLKTLHNSLHVFRCYLDNLVEMCKSDC